MSVSRLWGAALAAGLALGCRGKVDQPPDGVSAECQGVAALALQPAQTRIRVNEAVTLLAQGGSGHYSYGVQPGGSGGEVRGNRLFAGATPAKDQLYVDDVDCGGNATAQVEVMANFAVAPGNANVKPGTAFAINVAGQVGYPQFNLLQRGSGGTVSAQGLYTAGPTEGLDVVEVRDTQSGDQALLRFQVSKTAAFRAVPNLMAVVPGSWMPLGTADGTDSVRWRIVSGPGALDAANNLSVPVGATGTVQLEAKDAFTGQTATLRVRVMDELTRPTTAHGRLSDVAAMVSADFDGDGIADLAVGSAESDLNRPQGGAVFIFKGTAAGLADAPTWVLTGSSDTAQFGGVLAAGDLDGDGHADLAVSASGADITVADSGAVYLYKFDANGPQPLRPPLTGVGRGNFGTGLAIANFDGNGNAYLLVGSPNADLANPNDRRGVIDVFPVTKGGVLQDVAAIRLSGMDLAANGATVEKTTNTNAGRGLVAGDFNQDGLVDFAVMGQVTNSLLGGTAVAKAQTALAVYLSRGGAQPYANPPDAYVLPGNLADGFEGTWRLGFVPAGEGRPPLLMAVADNTDSPDLSASGGVKSGANSGGALLFDLSTAARGPAMPAQLGPKDAYARIYGDVAGISAGRSFALADVDAVAGLELLLGAPYASPTPVGTTTIVPAGGRVLVYGLANLKKGAVLNKPQSDIPGLNRLDCVGAGLAAWPLPGGTAVATVAARASTALGAFTGRVDVLTHADGAPATWPRRSAPLPAKAGVEQFGIDVAAGRNAAGKPIALVGAPGFSGPGSTNDGNDVGAGRALSFDITQPATASVVAQGAAAPFLAGGRGLGSDVSFTDFDGDGRQDMLIGAANLQVPSSATRAADITPAYAQENPNCIAASVQSVGGVLVQLGQADGTFKPAYRLWAPPDIAGCTPAGTTACRRSGIGRNLVGGFDFNGDGKQDVAAVRNNGLEVFLGRAPDDAQLGKLTMGCDPVYSAPFNAQATSAPAALGDLDGDGCAEVAYRTNDGAKSSLVIVFGFDPGGTRCGGRTVAASVRIADRDAGLNYLGLGVSTVAAGNFLGNGKRYLATGTTTWPIDGVNQNAVVLLDVAQLVARRPASGETLVGALGDTLTPLPLVPSGPRIFGIGRAMVGNLDLNGDGLPDLLVSSSIASYAGDGTGAVYAFSGAKGVANMEPFFVLAGDAKERSAFGASLSVAPGKGGSPPFLVVGAPSSYRTGTQNGTAYSVTLGF